MNCEGEGKEGRMPFVSQESGKGGRNGNISEEGEEMEIKGHLSLGGTVF